MRVRLEYQRLGVVLYRAAQNVATGPVLGDLVEANNTAAPLALLENVRGQQSSRSARRVFGVADIGSAYDPRTFPAVVAARWPGVTVVYTPTHGSGLNAIEP
ncbi:ISRSO5-transposase protein [mine drainage metagenome]|uniref:ISRSO5-transposase protein n=1 Tax=mine drainage metagenome TaxID=410659 RepID=T1B3Y0_9ZZZZ